MNEQTVTVIDTQQELGNEISLYKKQVADIVIENDEQYQSASEFLRQVKTLLKKVEEFWEPMRSSAYDAYKKVNENKKEMMKPLEEAEKILKSKIGQYTLELQRKQREREEELKRLAREEAERKLAEAMALQKSGDNESADYALAEAEVMENMANEQISVPVEKPKAEGISTTKSWSIKSIDADKVPVSIAGAVIRPVDEKAIMRLIKATGGTIQIPGVTYTESVSVSVRAG